MVEKGGTCHFIHQYEKPNKKYVKDDDRSIF